MTYGRYRIESESLRLRLTPRGIYVDGSGRVAFCPCAEPPVAIAFSGGRVAPPGDLFVTLPRLEVFGLPVFALPWLWIRAPNRVGLLPPVVAWRGDDGLLAGAGVHLPWRRSDGLRFVDVSAAGYVEGGAEIGVRAETPRSTTRFVRDHLVDDRVVLDARGSRPVEAPEVVSVAWEVDAIRGGRGRRGTIDLAAAAEPFDVAAAEANARVGSALVGSGLRARGFRSEGRAMRRRAGCGGVARRRARSDRSWDLETTGLSSETFRTLARFPSRSVWPAPR